MTRYWYNDNVVENVDGDENDHDEASVIIDIPPNHEFLGEIQISSDEIEDYPDDLEDSSLEDEFVHKDGVDL